MRLVQVLAAAALVTCGASAAEKTVKVLAVGNSFSANALRYFSDIVKASGNKTVAMNAMIGGCDMERHMRHADAFEKNPEDTEGHPYPGKKSLKELLTAEKWDFVTIQQASPKELPARDVSSARRAADRLHPQVRAAGRDRHSRDLGLSRRPPLVRGA
jgi:hypothetical protein